MKKSHKNSVISCMLTTIYYKYTDETRNSYIIPDACLCSLFIFRVFEAVHDPRTVCRRRWKSARERERQGERVIASFMQFLIYSPHLILFQSFRPNVIQLISSIVRISIFLFHNFLCCLGNEHKKTIQEI